MKCRRGAAIAVLAGASLAPLPAPASAQSAAADAVGGFESAGCLLRKCRENSAYARSCCFAYLAAVADSARSYRIWIGSGDPCLPAGLTMGKVADLFDAYLVANPSLTRAQAASVVVASVQEAFPCPVPLPVVAAPLPAPGPTEVPSEQPSDNQVDRAPQQRR